MISGNVGEWSELYAFVKLLADGKIFAADKNLEKNPALFYVILKIIRGEIEDYHYIRKEAIQIERSSGENIATIPLSDLANFANKLYSGMVNRQQGGRTFQLDFADEIMQTMYTKSLSDDRVETADIRIVIHDPITHHEPLLGFSIKSYIGSKPTLFNASKNSNLVYRIVPSLSEQKIEELNEMESYGNRISWLRNQGYKLEFVSTKSEVFGTNLELIDSRLPEILAEILLIKYFSGKSKISEIAEELAKSNPCHFNLMLNPNFYNYKIKRLLVDSALGMKAGDLWSGAFSATGGYIAVKKDGELLCFHIYNWNDFQDYLFNSTKIDLPDSSPNRCDYGRVVKSSEVGLPEGTYIKLNFQIRFA